MSRNVKSKGRDGGNESRTNLLSKIKFLEEELSRLDTERARLLSQLDKVCEEKDEQIKDLRTQLYEVGIENDHQVSLWKEEKKALQEELIDLKNMMTLLKAASENDVHQLATEKSALINKLEDLKEYLDHKEETMDRIKDLEETLANERSRYEQAILDFENQVQMEKQKMRKEVTREVQEITEKLEQGCLTKISQDARLALQRYAQVSAKLDETKGQLDVSMDENKKLEAKLKDKKMRLEVAESLLNEFLKQMQRAINARRSVGVQAHLTSKPNSNNSKKRDIFLISK